jgi:hypothetical protein
MHAAILDSFRSSCVMVEGANRNKADQQRQQLRIPRRFHARGRKTAQIPFDAHCSRFSPVIDSKILASAMAGLFAEFPYLTPKEQYDLGAAGFRRLRREPGRRCGNGGYTRGNPVPDMRNKRTALKRNEVDALSRIEESV